MSELLPEPQAQGNRRYGQSLEEEWVDATDLEQNQGPDAWAEMQPIPVKVTRTENERVAPDSVGLATYAIPLIPQASGAGALQAAMVCKHNYHRYKAKFLFSGGAAGTIYVAKDPNTLMSGALGNAFAIVVSGALAQAVQLMPEYDGAQPLYMLATVAGFSVSVMDEGYKVTQ